MTKKEMVLKYETVLLFFYHLLRCGLCRSGLTKVNYLKEYIDWRPQRIVVV